MAQRNAARPIVLVEGSADTPQSRIRGLCGNEFSWGDHWRLAGDTDTCVGGWGSRRRKFYFFWLCSADEGSRLRAPGHRPPPHPPSSTAARPANPREQSLQQKLNALLATCHPGTGADRGCRSDRSAPRFGASLEPHSGPHLGSLGSCGPGEDKAARLGTSLDGYSRAGVSLHLSSAQPPPPNA